MVMMMNISYLNYSYYLIVSQHFAKKTSQEHFVKHIIVKSQCL